MIKYFVFFFKAFILLARDMCRDYLLLGALVSLSIVLTVWTRHGYERFIIVITNPLYLLGLFIISALVWLIITFGVTIAVILYAKKDAIEKFDEENVFALARRFFGK